jgi:hypothetical protein
MDENDKSPQFNAAVGLCSACAYAQQVKSDRGSVFYLCGRAATDPAYPKYPRLPVTRCEGFVAPNEAENKQREAGEKCD